MPKGIVTNNSGRGKLSKVNISASPRLQFWYGSYQMSTLAHLPDGQTQRIRQLLWQIGDFPQGPSDLEGCTHARENGNGPSSLSIPGKTKTHALTEEARGREEKPRLVSTCLISACAPQPTCRSSANYEKP
jgi:hypothetical protein